jgi:hypothetical protein
MRLTLTLLVLLLHAVPGVAQAVRVPGTSVAIAPPPGFSPASRYPGFERADLQASIMVTEIPGPVAELTRGMTSAGLATRGMTLISSTKQVVDGRQALVMKVSQQAAGSTVFKWMIVSGTAKTSVMIVGTFPTSHDADIGDAIKASLLSAQWTAAAAPPDHFEGLPFRVASSAALKVAGRMSNLLLLSESGQMTPQSPDAAIFVVGSSVAAVDLGDLKAFSRQRAGQTKQLTDIRVLQERSTTIDGVAGYELVAEGTDAATGRAVTLYQVVLPDPSGYILMQGLVTPSRATVMVPEFRKVAQTFRRNGRQ